ncbi:hypothetical protein HNR23_002417 [Nocardiopsis mwathae]|uniref:Uncharacterized protein n=1 Tax=Nocardiopsis mwathae TaxID=1472723 RepID=A0A7W9YHR8_9ACTN|nr:hypothetical protein [Nocardiopsis mwathae]
MYEGAPSRIGAGRRALVCAVRLLHVLHVLHVLPVLRVLPVVPTRPGPG